MEDDCLNSYFPTPESSPAALVNHTLVDGDDAQPDMTYLFLELIPILLVPLAPLDVPVARTGRRIDASLAALELRGRHLGRVPLAAHAAVLVGGRRGLREPHVVVASDGVELIAAEGGRVCVARGGSVDGRKVVRERKRVGAVEREMGRCCEEIALLRWEGKGSMGMLGVATFGHSGDGLGQKCLWVDSCLR